MYRALATSNAFVAAGWRVTVITAERDAFDRLTGSDPASEQAIDPRVTIVRVPFESARGETDLARWTRERAKSPLLWSLRTSWREYRSFPETGYGGWATDLVAAAERVHDADPVDLTIGTANPNVDFAPGYALWSRHSVPYVMDYRDAWHLDLYDDKRIGSRLSAPARLEGRMLKNAREVWFVNQPILDWHAHEYPENSANFHVVANGFDPGFLDATRARLPNPRDGLVFGYLGSLYGPVPVRETFEGWRLARTRSPLLARSSLVIRGRIGRTAEPDPASLALFDEFAADSVSYGGPVSKTDVASVYRTFDALLLMLVKGKYVTSGKVFEYAATGLPILSLHDVDNASSAILAGHPAWIQTPDLSVESIAQSFVTAGGIAASMTAADYAAVRAWADHLSRDKQLAPRIAELARLVRS
jgi:glycosyltransferase involved in cell wall biosynthesis